jgi:ribosomal protein S18 acetylase RimI-like enzyme
VKFRTAEMLDVPAIVALVDSAYRGEASRAGWTTEADLLDGQRTDADEVSRMIEGADTRIVLAEDEEGLLASVVLRDEADAVYIGMFAVRPGSQGRGIGGALLAEAERIGRDELGSRHARMTVLTQREDLIAWYARRGYSRTGEREPFPYGDERFGIPRREDLVFDVLRKQLSRPS